MPTQRGSVPWVGRVRGARRGVDSWERARRCEVLATPVRTHAWPGTSEDWEALPRACAPSHRKKRGGLLAAVLISHPSFLVLESLNETLAEPPAACAIGYSRARTTSSGSGPQASFFYCLPVTPLCPPACCPFFSLRRGLSSVASDG